MKNRRNVMGNIAEKENTYRSENSESRILRRGKTDLHFSKGVELSPESSNLSALLNLQRRQHGGKSPFLIRQHRVLLFHNVVVYLLGFVKIQVLHRPQQIHPVLLVAEEQVLDRVVRSSLSRLEQLRDFSILTFSVPIWPTNQRFAS